MASNVWYCAACDRTWPLSVPLCPRDGTLSQPELVGSYQCVARIGSGATGEVYRAIDGRTGDKVAVKVLRPGVDLVPNFPAQPLTHEHLVGLREVGRREKGGTYLVSDLIAGTSLRGLIEGGPVEASLVAELGRQIATALAFLHQKDLMHGDLNPDNVTVEKQAGGKLHLRLIDVGFKSVGSEAARAPTPIKVVAVTKGAKTKAGPAGIEDLPSVIIKDVEPSEARFYFSPRYTAPELIVERKPSPAADVYALGCTLFELVTGNTPFSGEAVSEILHKHRLQPAPALVVDGQAHPLDDLVRRCLAKPPSERPTAAAAIKELAALATKLSRKTAKTDPSFVPPGGAPLPAPVAAAAATSSAASDTLQDYPAPVLAALQQGAAPATAAMLPAGGGRPLPSDTEIERRLGVTSKKAPLGGEQMATAIRQALRCGRELDELILGTGSLDPEDVRALVRGLGLASDQFELWWERTHRGDTKK